MANGRRHALAAREAAFPRRGLRPRRERAAFQHAADVRRARPGGRRARDRRGDAAESREAALAALEAGCDLVLLCNQSLDGGAAVDELLDGLAEAQARGDWQPDPDSETRRLDLLPQTAPLTWDELMHHAPYQRALERLP